MFMIPAIYGGVVVVVVVAWLAWTLDKVIVNDAEPSEADGVEINCRDNPVLPPLGTVTDTGARVTPETEVCSVGVIKASLLPTFLT